MFECRKTNEHAVRADVEKMKDGNCFQTRWVDVDREEVVRSRCVGQQFFFR